MNQEGFLRLVKGTMGWPVLKPLQQDEDIVEQCLTPALKQYFRWWPLERREEYAVDRIGGADAPANTHGILQWEFLDKMVNPPNELLINDPFILATRMNPGLGLGTVKDLSDWAMATIREENRMSQLRYIKETNKIEFYSNVPGYFAVTYAGIGTFDDVPVKHEEYLTKLASIEFLRREAMIRGLAQLQTGMDVRTEMLTEKADRYEEEMKELKRQRSVHSLAVVWG